MVIVPAVGARVRLELTVNAPPTEKLAVGWVVGVPAIVNPEKVKVPELDIVQAVPAIVMVPAAGVKVTKELIVKAPPTEKLALV